MGVVCPPNAHFSKSYVMSLSAALPTPPTLHRSGSWISALGSATFVSVRSVVARKPQALCQWSFHIQFILQAEITVAQSQPLLVGLAYPNVRHLPCP